MGHLPHQFALSAITPLAEQEISAEVLVEKYSKGNTCP
jgi:hypothetical protein